MDQYDSTLKTRTQHLVYGGYKFLVRIQSKGPSLNPVAQACKRASSVARAQHVEISSASL